MKIEFYFNGEPISASEGDTVASALWAAGHRSLRRSVKLGEPRGLLCGMGVCQECVVTIDGRKRESCMTLVRPGLLVTSTS